MQLESESSSPTTAQTRGVFSRIFSIAGSEQQTTHTIQVPGKRYSKPNEPTNSRGILLGKCLNYKVPFEASLEVNILMYHKHKDFCRSQIELYVEICAHVYFYYNFIFIYFILLLYKIYSNKIILLFIIKTIDFSKICGKFSAKKHF